MAWHHAMTHAHGRDSNHRSSSGMKHLRAYHMPPAPWYKYDVASILDHLVRFVGFRQRGVHLQVPQQLCTTRTSARLHTRTRRGTRRGDSTITHTAAAVQRFLHSAMIPIHDFDACPRPPRSHRRCSGVVITREAVCPIQPRRHKHSPGGGRLGGYIAQRLRPTNSAFQAEVIVGSTCHDAPVLPGPMTNQR